MRGTLKEQPMNWTNCDYLVKQEIFNPDKMIKFLQHYMVNGDVGKGLEQNFSKIVWSYFIFPQ